MWEMFDTDIECDDCGGPGPPPKFMVPPPPRPPFMHELTKCSEEEPWDFDMCEAIPILDASYHSSPSLQTSAMIAVFSLLLVLVVLISSLFVWKHKRKVQNFLPCKTPTRGPHLSAGVPGGHSVTYEDPDAHLGHRPLVMRHHHNVEMLHPKSIHYPSGYPMTRSPPLFVCSSPGPDPYRSHDNVYEELGPGRESDGESDPPMHSDDDFAEDELSLPGERSFNKASPDQQQQQQQQAPVSTIYHERINSNGVCLERNSLVSSSSSTGTTNTASASGGANSNYDQRNGILTGVIRQSGCGGIVSGGRSKQMPHQHNNNSSSSCNTSSNKNSNRKISNYSADELNTSSEQAGSDIVPPPIYDDRNLMTLPFNNHNSILNSYSNNNNCNSNNNSSISNRNQCLSTSTAGLLIDNEVERRNRINNQLHHPPPVSTIFRERMNYNTARYPQPYYTHHNLISNSQQQQQRSRTNPRSLDRRRIGVPIDHEPTYGYAEPVFHEGLLYDAYLAHPVNSPGATHTLRSHPYPCILPEFTTFRTLGNSNLGQQLLPPQPQQIYSRDSSFGSDSGYSHHTQASGRGGSGDSSGGGGGGSNGGATGNSSTGSGFGGGRKNSSNNSSSSGIFGSGVVGAGSKIGLNFTWNRRGAKDSNNPSNTSSSNTNSNNNNNININNNKSKTYENS